MAETFFRALNPQQKKELLAKFNPEVQSAAATLKASAEFKAQPIAQANRKKDSEAKPSLKPRFTDEEYERYYQAILEHGKDITKIRAAVGEHRPYNSICNKVNNFIQRYKRETATQLEHDLYAKLTQKQ